MNNTNEYVDITRFGKEQILKSDRYQRYVDVLSFLLEDDRLYQFNEVEEIINKYLDKGAI